MARRVKMAGPVLRLVKLASLLVVAVAALEAPASAQVTTYDHRTEAQPSPAPTVSYDQPHPYRHRPGPRWMLPLRFDIGAVGANTQMGYLPGMELRLGVHWASLSPTPTNFDIGLGVFGAALVGPTNNTSMGSSDSNDVVYGGAYLEVGETLSHGDWWRTWASGRAEYLGSDAFGKSSSGYGVAGRLSAEIYASGVGIEPRGLFLGTYAIGVYAEVGGRQLGDGVSALQVSGGLTFRTPLVFEP